MDVCVADMLLNVWSQTRYLQFPGKSDSQGVRVDQNLPQGDNFFPGCHGVPLASGSFRHSEYVPSDHAGPLRG